MKILGLDPEYTFLNTVYFEMVSFRLYFEEHMIVFIPLLNWGGRRMVEGKDISRRVDSG